MKIIEWLKTNVNHTWFNYFVMLISITFVYIANKYGDASIQSIIGIFAGVSANVLLWIGIVFGLEYFQLGIGKNIKKEIYEENNIAAAIYELGIKLSIAWVIAKGLL